MVEEVEVASDGKGEKAGRTERSETKVEARAEGELGPRASNTSQPQDPQDQPQAHATMSSSEDERKHILVLGGGIIGLSIAIAMQDCGCHVSLLAADLPHDGSSTSSQPPPEYASSWAGAHHVSSAADAREERWDKETFEVISRLAPPPASDENDQGSLVWVRQTELFARPVGTEQEERAQAVLQMYPNHVSDTPPPTPWATTSQLPYKAAHTFDTLDFDVPRYLPALLRHFARSGGRVLPSERASSIVEALRICNKDDSLPSGWPNTQGVFIATGLGAASLAELAADAPNHYPVRGQTVLVNAPWLKLDDKNGSSSSPRWPALSRTNEQGERDLYLIPRSRGQYIVGGTRLPHDDDPRPRDETTRAILTRALQVCPGLVSPEKREERASRCEPLSHEDLDIVRVNVGFRPARKGGPLLQAADEEVNRQVGAQVVLAYGFGGYGYQNSWGPAFEARDVMLEKLGLPGVGHRLDSLTSLA